jgi:hypothetical protein
MPCPAELSNSTCMSGKCDDVLSRPAARLVRRGPARRAPARRACHIRPTRQHAASRPPPSRAAPPLPSPPSAPTRLAPLSRTVAESPTISGAADQASAASHYTARIPLPANTASALFNTLVGSTQIGAPRLWQGLRPLPSTSGPGSRWPRRRAVLAAGSGAGNAPAARQRQRLASGRRAQGHLRLPLIHACLALTSGALAPAA